MLISRSRFLSRVAPVGDPGRSSGQLMREQLEVDALNLAEQSGGPCAS